MVTIGKCMAPLIFGKCMAPLIFPPLIFHWQVHRTFDFPSEASDVEVVVLRPVVPPHRSHAAEVSAMQNFEPDVPQANRSLRSRLRATKTEKQRKTADPGSLV